MSSQNQQHETTVWLWPTGLFPRRVVYYLRAKNITSSVLHEKNIHLIPLFLDKDAPTPDLVPHPGLEARPTGTSVPALRITYADGTIFWIYESNAIMEYFEEVLSVDNGYLDVRGATIQQRARTRDILSLLSDVITWSNVALVHSDPNTLSWSGLTEGEMSESAAKHARGKFHMLLSRLEARIQGDVVGNKSESLSGDGANVTLADLCIMAQVEYMQEMYGLDWVAEHGVLRVWYDRTKGQNWVASKSALQDVERTVRTTVFPEPVDESSIRLLRFSQPEDGVFVGKLQKFAIASAPHYYTASYVWGERKYKGAKINLKTGGLPILNSLVPFIHMVTRHGDFKTTDWWWIDSLCINLDDPSEREKQVRIMADIYKRARRAIVWLGEEKEDGSDCTDAIDFMHYLSTLQIGFNGDDLAMRKKLENPEFTDKCAAVSNLLARPWWTRVWTLQEFVLPKEAKLYCGVDSISRGRFKSAIYSIFLCSTISKDFEHELVPRKLFDGAFNRRRIHQWHTKPASIGINLIAIMAYLGNHSATDSRDRIYSVLGLITEQDRALIGPAEYTTSIAHQFARLVRSFWTVHRSLDIVCFAHLFCPNAAVSDPGVEDPVPTWSPDWRTTIDFASPVPLMASQSACEHIGNFRPLRSTRWKAIYDAPGETLRKEADVSFSEDLKELHCNGVVLDTIHGLGGLDERELRCESFVCREAGHDLMQSQEYQHSASRVAKQPAEWLEAIARSLVIDRRDKYLCFQAPSHYISDFLFLCHACVDGDPVDWSFATWFERNRHVMFGNMSLEDIVRQIPTKFSSPAPTLHRPPSHPVHQMNDKLDTFLSRFHDTVRKKVRRLMVTEQGYVGMAPCRARPGDVVAILFGCSIPLVLRKVALQAAWQVVGEGFVHGQMNGEIADELKSGTLNVRRLRLV